MRAVLAVALFLVAALSGCTAPAAPIKTLGADDTDATPTASATNSSAPNETTPPPNTPPNASLTSNATNGSVPLNVTFTLGGTDGENDTLNWTLDADGNGVSDGAGDALPANVSFTFSEPGNFTAILYVTDGNATVNATVDIVVTAAGGKEDLWARWDAEGLCHAKGARSAGPVWIHDRPAEGEPFGTGFVDEAGGGIWIYEESNDVPGLQIGGPGEAEDYAGCLNPDTLIF